MPFPHYWMLLSLHAGRWDKDKLFCNIIIFHFRLSPATPLLKSISVPAIAIVRKCQLQVHTSRGFIYWLLGEQHYKRSGCNRDERRGERGESTKGHKVWGEKSGVKSTEIVQPYVLYVWGDLMLLQLRTYFHSQLFPAIWNLCRV